MKNRIIAANWKSNKTKNEAKNWLEEVSKSNLPTDLEIVILAPFTLLDFMSSYISQNSLPVKIGAQNVSMFEKGPYTGEINAEQIKEFSEYVLIGHSERRSNFNEDEEAIKKKLENSLSAGLIPMVCVSNFEQARNFEFAENAIFVFEPPSAISTNPDSKPEDQSIVSDFAQKFGSTFNNQLIYGGSINAQNVGDYLNISGISGVLIGAESLSAQNFSEILKNAI